MKLCVAQIKPVTGNISQNIRNHIKVISLAAEKDVNVIIFPELSLTGYEPGLARDLAFEHNDHRLDVFQETSDQNNIVIGVGLPLRHEDNVMIGLMLFHPGAVAQTYTKSYLHPDEEPFFAAGKNECNKVNGTNIALAICYEISVLQHTSDAFSDGADAYVASVAKFKSGIVKASSTLSGIAAQYKVPVLMANCVGYADGNECAGSSSVWNKQGTCMAKLNDHEEGLIIFDTETGAIEKYSL